MSGHSTCSWGALSDRQVEYIIDKYLHPQSGGAGEEYAVDNEGRFSPWEGQRLLLKGGKLQLGLIMGWSWLKKT